MFPDTETQPGVRQRLDIAKTTLVILVQLCSTVELGDPRWCGGPPVSTTELCRDDDGVDSSTARSHPQTTFL